MKPNRKLRKPSATSKLVLEEVIGLTTKDAQGLASTVNTPYCVYPAGCVAVVYDSISGTKSHLLVSHRSPKPLRCVAVSLDGRIIGAGELGHQPAVLVWDSAAQTCMAELKGHQYGVSCIAFSPDGKLLVSVGYPRDGQLCLWEWRSGIMVAKLKACSSCSAVSSVSFSVDGKLVVTAGRRHLKTWSIRHARALSKTRTPSLAMTGTPVNLGCQKGLSFVSVVSMNMTYGNLVASDRSISSFPLYALTETGVLCVIQSGNSISQEVDLMVEKGFGLSASGNLLACACSSGTVQLFHIDNLSHAANLHHSEAISCPDSNGVAYLKRSAMDAQLIASHPDAVSCAFLMLEKLVVVYSDNSLYLWDIHDVFKPTRCCVLVAHSACIMDIKTLPCEHMHHPSIACVSRGCSGGVSFATCSADGTIRLWDLAFEPLRMNDANQKLALNESSGTVSVGAACLVSAGIFERDIVQGFRSMAVSPDGKYLAAGDSQGNLYIYDLHTYDYTCLQGAHDAEILSLSFSLPWKIDSTLKVELNNLYFLASGGRDGAIHIFDANRNFKLIASINDHSAAVTSLKLSSSGCHILSCSADRSLVLQDIILTDNSCQILHRHCLKVPDGTVYDIATDPNLEIVITAGQDKKIKKFNLATGKLLKSFKQDGDYGDPIKVAVDPSCSYLVCSYSNKSICMYDFATGEKVAAAMGHGELITGVAFLPDCRHIISVGGDGCIFFWSVPSPFASSMRQKMNESSGWLSPESTMLPLPSSFIKFQKQNYNGHESHSKDISSPGSSKEACHRLHNRDWSPKVISTFKYSFSKLPKWAQSKVTDAVAVQRDKVSACQSSADYQQPELNNTFPMTVNDSGNDTLCSRAEIPSQQDTYNCEPCPSSPAYNNSPASPLSACHRSTVGNHWRMIHTVCLDLLSPEVWSNEAKVQLPWANLVQKPTSEMLHDVKVKKFSLENPPKFMKSSTQCGTQYEQALNNHTKCYDFCLQDNVTEQATVHNAFKCHHAPDRASEQMLTEEKDCPSSTAMDTEVCDVVLQDDCLFNQHFGNLSATLKEKRPSAKRSYSARFTLRRDRLRGVSSPSDATFTNSRVDIYNLRDDLSSHLSVSNLPAQNLANSTRSNLGLTRRDSSNTSFAMNNSSVNVGVITDQEYVHGENTMMESISACKEALSNLDAAANITFQSFSELNRMVTAEDRPERTAHLYEEAVDMLPLIAKTVDAITQMVHPKMTMFNGAELKDQDT